jgi:hypothetical protein
MVSAPHLAPSHWHLGPAFWQSTTYRKAQDRKAIFMTLGKLQPQLAQRIDFSNTSFWSAANNIAVMNIIERSRVRVWLRNNYAQFDKLAGKKLQPAMQIYVDMTIES